MEPNRAKRVHGLMRRSDRIGQAGGVGSKSIADAKRKAAYRPFAHSASQDATAAERAHSRGAESLELVTVAGSLLESSKELLQLSHAQIGRFISRRGMKVEELASYAGTRRPN